LVSKLVLISGQ